MAKEKLKMEITLPVQAEKIYNAWLSSKTHSEFTGGEAKISGKVNSKFTAWDGYITGKIIALEKNKKITQTWRTTEFPDDAEDSVLEVKLKPVKKGTKLILIHTHLPKGGKKKYTAGWKEYYFEPMAGYFSE
ncbi:MAG: SRPBCC domain-containing protein [Bacteroidota bacterium]